MLFSNIAIIIFYGLYLILLYKYNELKKINKNLNKENNELVKNFNKLSNDYIKEKNKDNACKKEIETYVKPFEKEITHDGKIIFFFEAQSFRVLQSAGADMVTINKETCICGCRSHNHYIVNVYGNSGLIFQLLAK